MTLFTLLDTFLEDGYYVTQNYFARPEYYSKFGLLGHEGVDFSHTDKQKPVRTPLSGTVFVGSGENYGNYVVVEDYDQLCGVYLCHFDRTTVSSGQHVSAGDVVGIMGSTGNSTGAHVHLNFIILDNNGNKKYNLKSQNRGFLDPRYPRDSGKPVEFPGVEIYKNKWTTKEDDMADMYKGYDLSNRESMMVAVDILVRVNNGEFVDRPVYEKEVQAHKKTAEELGEAKRQIEQLNNELENCSDTVLDPKLWDNGATDVETQIDNTRYIRHYTRK